MPHADRLERRDTKPTPFPRSMAGHGLASLQDNALTARIYLSEYFALKVYPKCMLSSKHTIGEKVWMFSLFAQIIYLKSQGTTISKARIAAELGCNPHTLTKHLDNLVDVGLICPDETYDGRMKVYTPCDADTSTACWDLVRSLREGTVPSDVPRGGVPA